MPQPTHPGKELRVSFSMLILFLFDVLVDVWNIERRFAGAVLADMGCERDRGGTRRCQLFLANLDPEVQSHLGGSNYSKEGS